MSTPPNKRPQTAPKPPQGLEPATWGRRIAALFIDWITSSLVLIAVAGWSTYRGPSGTTLVLPVLFAEVVLFTWLIGGSFGQVVLKLRVRRLDGTPLPPVAVVVRTILIVLVVPPLIYKPDGRGLHDLAVGSATYRVA